VPVQQVAPDWLLQVDDDEVLSDPLGVLASVGRQVARAVGWSGVAVELEGRAAPLQLQPPGAGETNLARVELGGTSRPATALQLFGPTGDAAGARALAEAGPAIARMVARLQRRFEDRQLGELSEAFLVVVDVTGTIRSVNQAFCQLVGRPAGNLVGSPVWPLVHPDDRGRAEHAARRLLGTAARTTGRLEGRVLAGDGSWRELSWRATPRVAEGRLYVVARDESFSARVAEYERDQRAMLRAIAGGAPLEDTLSDLSYAVERRLGDVRVSVLLTDEEAVLHAVAGTLAADFAQAVGGLAIDRVVTPCTRALRDDTLLTVPDLLGSREYSAVHHVAERYGIEACWSIPVTEADGEAMGVLAVYPPAGRRPQAADVEVLEAARDLVRLAVTSARAREQLRASEERFRLVSIASSDVVYDHDLDRGTIWWGTDAHDPFGWDERADVTPAQWWRDRVRAEDLARAEAQLEGQPGDEVHATYRVQRGDGTWAEVEDRACITVGADGHVHRVGGITDVSALRAAEEARLREQRMDSLGALAGGIAHDLNNVLTPIVMASSLLAETVDADDAPTVEMISRAANRGADMVRQVLAFARGMGADEASVPVHEAVGQVGSTLLEAMPRSVHLRVDLDDDLPPAAIDRTQLQQVVVNLVLNARDAMDGSGRIDVRAWAGTRSDGEPLVHLAVEDTGRGIEPDHLPRIFEEFFTTKETARGTGLGLPISRTLVERAGGNITVASEVGTGTTFVVSLPAAEAVRRAATPERRNRVSGAGRRLLVVEDEQAIQTLVAQTLTSSGFVVMSASDGAEGLSIFARHAEELDVVLLDLDLPVLGGRAALDAMRRIHPRIPVVVMSTPDASPDLEGCTLLPKPFDSEELLAAVAAASDRSRGVGR
jgi:PAS domain S-box-containing protein